MTKIAHLGPKYGNMTAFKVRPAFVFQIGHFSKVWKPFKNQAYFTLYMIWYHVYDSIRIYKIELSLWNYFKDIKENAKNGPKYKIIVYILIFLFSDRFWNFFLVFIVI